MLRSNVLAPPVNMSSRHVNRVHDPRELVITNCQLGLLFKFRVIDWYLRVHRGRELYCLHFENWKTQAYWNAAFVSLIRLSLAFLNSPRRVWLREIFLLWTPFCAGVTVNGQQPVSGIIEIMHYDIMLHNLTFQCDSCANIIKLYKVGSNASYKLIKDVWRCVYCLCTVVGVAAGRRDGGAAGRRGGGTARRRGGGAAGRRGGGAAGRRGGGAAGRRGGGAAGRRRGSGAAGRARGRNEPNDRNEERYGQNRDMTDKATDIQKQTTNETTNEQQNKGNECIDLANCTLITHTDNTTCSLHE